MHAICTDVTSDESLFDLHKNVFIKRCLRSKRNTKFAAESLQLLDWDDHDLQSDLEEDDNDDNDSKNVGQDLEIGSDWEPDDEEPDMKIVNCVKNKKEKEKKMNILLWFCFFNSLIIFCKRIKNIENHQKKLNQKVKRKVHPKAVQGPAKNNQI